ncbi:MAG TPA: AarF/UbiB family protein [Gemmatimonadaceae bacterium]|nr:AarF/UbiB family protein [Gemmatimonadaceae bacterium]
MASTRPGFRVARIYLTMLRVLGSYLWLRIARPMMSPARYQARLIERHRRNARRVQRAIVDAGGLFIKVGQLISILSNVLPPEFRGELESLQDRLPPRPYEEVAARIRADFGRPAEELFREIDPVPIATASLAQVHQAWLHDGRKVAVKAQHRDIERIAREDLELIRRLLRIIQFVTGVRGLESYHPEIGQMINEELDFAREAQNLETIARNFAGDSGVRCPAVVPGLSTRCVLTTTFMEGTKVTDLDELRARAFAPRTIAERVVTAYCRMIFVDGMYHADPHPGNILVAPDGAIVFVDFGAVGVLAPHMREGIPEFFEGLIRRDPKRITEAIRTMGFVARGPESGDVAERVIGYMQRRFFEQMTAQSWGLRDLQMDMRSKIETLADLRRLDVSFRKLTETFQVPKDWVLLERTLLLLVGLCTELDASWNPMAVIEPYLERVVLTGDRDWGSLMLTAMKEMARVAATLPEDLRQTLTRANAGELEIRVPEIAAAAELIYAGAHQLIYAVIGIAAGVVAYQAYDRGRSVLATALLVAAIVAFVALGASMLARRRSTR